MRRNLLPALLLLSMLRAPAAVAAPPPAAGGAFAPGPKEKCAVCGMFVAKYPDWACAVRFADGSEAWFDGAKDLFKYLSNVPKYAPGRRRADVRTFLVKDYYALKPIDGAQAYYVVGSDVYGPMGDELIPFASPADAKAFTAEHGGKKTLRATDVTPALLKSM